MLMLTFLACIHPRVSVNMQANSYKRDIKKSNEFSKQTDYVVPKEELSKVLYSNLSNQGAIVFNENGLWCIDSEL